LIATIVALSPPVACPAFHDAQPESPTELTIKGNVLCNRATDTKDWFWDPKDGDHTPVIHIRPNIHGAATGNGTIWEGGSPIFRVVVESGTTS
jgi:hypothetical protein